MNKFITYIVFIFMVQFALNVLVSAQSSCWSNFRGDAALTGVSDASLPKDPQLLWSFKTNDAIKASPVVCHGVIVVGSLDGNIFGISLDGTLKWKINTENGVEAPALIVDQTAYIGDLDGKVYAIDVETGRLRWVYETEGQISGSPNYYQKGNVKVLVIGSYDYYLHGIDAGTGKGLWKFESNNFINGAASIYRGNAIFGGCDGLLHKVRVTDGYEISSQEVASYVAGSPAIEDGKAYVGDYDGLFSCLDIDNPRKLWSFVNEQNKQPILGSPALSEKYVFIGSRDKHVYCFDKKTGEEKWKVNTRGNVDASTVLLRKKLLVANMRGDILLINTSDGKITWSYELGSPVSATPAIIKDHIIVGAEDGRVYCFGNQ